MGLINKKPPTKKSTLKKVPSKKIPKKPNKEQIEKPLVEEVNEEIVEQVSEEIQKETINETQTEETDVNADEKNDVCASENLETEEKSETETKNEEEKVEDVSELNTLEETAEDTIKTKKKRGSKKSKSKITVDKIDTENMITDYNEATEYLSDTINFTSEEWEKEKEELTNQVKSLYISPDLNPDSIKKLLSEMSITYTTLKERLCDAEAAYNSLDKKIKDIKTLNSIGANANERNINAQKAVMFYKNNPNDEKCIDLELYLNAIGNKVNFFKSEIDTMVYNRQLLITFASAFKIEVNNY